MCAGQLDHCLWFGKGCGYGAHAVNNMFYINNPGIGSNDYVYCGRSACCANSQTVIAQHPSALWCTFATLSSVFYFFCEAHLYCFCFSALDKLISPPEQMAF